MSHALVGLLFLDFHSLLNIHFAHSLVYKMQSNKTNIRNSILHTYTDERIGLSHKHWLPLQFE